MPILARNFSIYNEYHTSYYGFYIGYKRSSILGKIKFKIKDFFISYIENFYNNIIFLNQSELEYYNRKNGIVISNFFDPTNPKSVKAKKNQIISLGRLTHQKGYDMLIEAWSKLDNKVENWTIKIYGSGEDKEKLIDLLRSYNFKNTFEINDAVSDVNPLLAESQFYVMSSRFETFPMVLLEALSNGLPVVSFDCPSGPRSIVKENEDSLLAKPNDINDLAEKMLLLISNEELVNKMSGMARININRFNPSLIMKQWDDLIIKNNL